MRAHAHIHTHTHTHHTTPSTTILILHNYTLKAHIGHVFNSLVLMNAVTEKI